MYRAVGDTTVVVMEWDSFQVEGIDTDTVSGDMGTQVVGNHMEQVDPVGNGKLYDEWVQHLQLPNVLDSYLSSYYSLQSLYL